jgi:hypothetical protein
MCRAARATMAYSRWWYMDTCVAAHAKEYSREWCTGTSRSAHATVYSRWWYAET